MSVCCLILILLPLSCMGGDVTQTLFSNIADDVMFDESLISSMTARSKLDCARRCSSDPNCKTFTFTKGLETLHTMTSSGNWALRIDLGDWEGNTAYATYTGFYITSCADNYRLMFDLGSYSGDAGANTDERKVEPP
nr:hypothetical protein BaRGS_014946 [Batillaria attramentaria]